MPTKLGKGELVNNNIMRILASIPIVGQLVESLQKMEISLMKLLNIMTEQFLIITEKKKVSLE